MFVTLLIGERQGVSPPSSRAPCDSCESVYPVSMTPHHILIPWGFSKCMAPGSDPGSTFLLVVFISSAIPWYSFLLKSQISRISRPRSVMAAVMDNLSSVAAGPYHGHVQQPPAFCNSSVLIRVHLWTNARLPSLRPSPRLEVKHDRFATSFPLSNATLLSFAVHRRCNESRRGPLRRSSSGLEFRQKSEPRSPAALGGC